MRGRPSKYLEMLRDKEVARWYGQVSQGSRKTAKVYLRRLGYACDRYHTTPRAVAKLDRKGIRDFMVDMVNDMDAKGNAGGYIESALKAAKSWLRFNLRPIGEIRVKIPRLNETPTIANEVVPSKEELARILAAKDIRAKVAVALVAFTSVRPEVVGSTTDGLRLRDLPELSWDQEAKRASFSIVPALVRVRAPISKLGHEYIIFLNAQGCEFVKQYLEMRMRAGERLTPDSALLTQKYATQFQERPKFKDTVSKRRGDLITVENVRDLIRSAIRSAGFRWRPYILRRYFDHNMLLNATARGVVSRDFVVFWMGHAGDMEHVYTLHKSIPQEAMKAIDPMVHEGVSSIRAEPRTGRHGVLTLEQKVELLLISSSSGSPTGCTPTCWTSSRWCLGSTPRTRGWSAYAPTRRWRWPSTTCTSSS
jgi:hypothetical protein